MNFFLILITVDTMVCSETITSVIDSCLEQNPCEIDIQYNKPIAQHCSFKVGGPADCWIRPAAAGFQPFVHSLLASSSNEKIPVFILGAGANILVADRGIRGIVLDMNSWTGETEQQRHEGIVHYRSGTSLDSAADCAAEAGLSGLEFLAGMPGSIGGSVWMNARCYDQEIADVLINTAIIDYSGDKPGFKSIPANKKDFSYKHSPFQGNNSLILSAAFQLTDGDPRQIRSLMEEHRRDRESKGHFRYPSAGSVFKNNRSFGKPSGKIIDELGLCGLRINGAQVAPWHGNFIINTGGATAADIRALVNEVSMRVKNATGFELEPEILFVGF